MKIGRNSGNLSLKELQGNKGEKPLAHQHTKGTEKTRNRPFATEDTGAPEKATFSILTSVTLCVPLRPFR
jgi:hypothetical protein